MKQDRMPRAAIVATLVLALAGCSICNEEVASEARAPKGLHTAKVIYVGCGATTPDYTRVDVKSYQKTTKELERQVFIVRNRQGVELQWAGDAELLVRCSGCVEELISWQVTQWGIVKISYDLGKGGGPKVAAGHSPPSRACEHALRPLPI
jgi:hypothetical protein